MTKLDHVLSSDSQSLLGSDTANYNKQKWLPCKWKNSVSSCRICLSNLFQPAALNCGHQFCEHCLNQYWTTYKKPDHIVCPLCRTEASDISFLAKEKTRSTHDFRKMFDRQYSPSPSPDFSKTFKICLQLSAVAPAVYLFIKFLWTVLQPFFLLLQSSEI